MIQMVTNNDALSNAAPSKATGNPISTYSSPLNPHHVLGIGGQQRPPVTRQVQDDKKQHQLEIKKPGRGPLGIKPVQKMFERISPE